MSRIALHLGQKRVLKSVDYKQSLPKIAQNPAENRAQNGNGVLCDGLLRHHGPQTMLSQLMMDYSFTLATPRVKQCCSSSSSSGWNPQRI